VAEAQQAALASFLAGGKAARYPDPCAHALRVQLAARLGVPEGNVLVTNGGDEALYLMCLAFGGPGRTLVDVPPSFSVYSLYARMSGTRVVEVPRDPATWAINWPALEAAAQTANLVVVTSPNNPTGDVAPREELLHLVEHTPALVLVDEAYLEFSEGTTSLVREACQRENLVVLRTLSKAFGRAGARLGYLVAPTYVIEALQALRQPYSVNALSQVLAAATLEHAPAFEPYLTTVRRERNQLVAALNQLPGVRAWPSEANFVLVQLPHAHTVRERLRTEHCILVRDFSTAPATPECLRITVGTPAECAATLAALTQILANPTTPKEAQ
jgi:histidinol-phosphate aminotransferase